MESRLKSIEDRLERVEDKQDRILEEIIENKIINSRNTSSLEDHILRTNLLQEEIEDVRTELKPVQKHVALVDAGLRFAGAIALIASFAAAILNIVRFFKS